MLMTKEQYIESIKKRRPMNVYFRGKKIEDLTTFPALAASFNTICTIYDLAQRPDWKGLITVPSHLNGEEVSVYNAPLRSVEDAQRKTRAARALGEVVSCCTHRCTGSEAFAGLGPTCYDMDQELGTHYFDRFMKFLDYVQRNDLSCTVTVTDVKGLRTLPPSKQPDKDMYIHIDEVTADGIYVSGFKCNQTGILFAHEVICIPTTSLKPEDKEFAVACAIPADDPGLTFVLGRTPQDRRFEEVGGDIEGIDLGKNYADHQALVYINHVFVPNERVFLCGETKYVSRLLSYFTAVHRLTAGGCKAGGCTALCGATALITEMVGVEKAGHIKTKLTHMMMDSETVYGLSLTAATEGFKHPSGFFIPNPLNAHVCKYNCTKLPFDAVRYARDIIAGFGETAPSEADLRDPEIGPMVQRAFNPGNPKFDAFDRLRAVRFIEHMARGSNWTAMALHGGGNMEAATVMARMYTDWNHLKDIVRAQTKMEKDPAKRDAIVNEIGKRRGRACNYGDLPKVDEE